ncbi:hypothetical protein [Sphingomonas faeni]|uniref:hypothetical protein n=1 Tax=Sphingomonas faeni TaxID=185950 RepID=UPI002780BE30|nr:hypothetical protein [Sphingomonas faeni]MDQ0836953.1 hypothetical protein [Sphingomonas faeni]
MTPQERLQNLQAKKATAKTQNDAHALARAADDAARMVNVEADVLGLPRLHEQMPDAKRAELIEAQAACVRIMEFVDKQLPGALQDVEHAQAERRRAQGQHVRSEVVPPLLATAQEAGALFGRALASLAAAEDYALRLHSRQATAYVEGNASMLCAAMSKTAGQNIFCDTGPGRGAWDWAGYSETTARIEEEIQEIEA